MAKVTYKLVLIDDFKAGNSLLRNGKILMVQGVLQPGVSQKFVNLAMNNGRVACVKDSGETVDQSSESETSETEETEASAQKAKKSQAKK